MIKKITSTAVGGETGDHPLCTNGCFLHEKNSDKLGACKNLPFEYKLYNEGKELDDKVDKCKRKFVSVYAKFTFKCYKF